MKMRLLTYYYSRLHYTGEPSNAKQGEPLTILSYLHEACFIEYNMHYFLSESTESPFMQLIHYSVGNRPKRHLNIHKMRGCLRLRN